MFEIFMYESLKIVLVLFSWQQSRFDQQQNEALMIDNLVRMGSSLWKHSFEFSIILFFFLRSLILIT